jgi:hypothetical protein
MGDHDTLRYPCGASGKCQLAQILLGIDLHLRGYWIVFIQESPEFIGAFGERSRNIPEVIAFSGSDDDLLQVAIVFNSQDNLEALFSADDDFTVGTTYFMKKTLFGAQEAGRHHGSAGFLNGPIADHELHAVRQIDADPVSFLDAEFGQSGSQLINPRLQLTVVNASAQI